MVTLAQGTILSNEKLCELFLCSPQGGDAQIKQNEYIGAHH